MQHSSSSEALGGDQAKAVSTHEFLLQAEHRDGGFVVTGVQVDGKQVFPGKSQRAQLQFNDLSDLETWLVRKIAPAAKVDGVDYPEMQQPLRREQQVPECMYNAPVKMQITKGSGVWRCLVLKSCALTLCCCVVCDADCGTCSAKKHLPSRVTARKRCVVLSISCAVRRKQAVFW